jgi:phosphatidylglycerol:prolipoprotein diacylglycerol transferase
MGVARRGGAAYGCSAVHPVLFRIGSVPVLTHDLLSLLGLVVAVGVFVIDIRRRGLLRERRLWWMVYGALLGGAIGAKAATAWRYVVADGPTLPGVLLDGGKSVVGGLAGAYLGALLVKRLLGYRRPTGDLFAPAVALGIAVGRIGCFLTEQLGTPTSLPWGITLSPEVATRVPNCPQCLTGVPLHPSFLYEIGFLVALFFVLRWLRPRMPVEGELFKVFLVTYGTFRFVVEFVRGNELMWNGLSGTQLFLIPSVLLLVAALMRQLLRGQEPRGAATVPAGS